MDEGTDFALAQLRKSVEKLGSSAEASNQHVFFCNVLSACFEISAIDSQVQNLFCGRKKLLCV